MPDVSKTLEWFSSQWLPDRRDYRGPEDSSWKSYATALRELVAAGRDSKESSAELTGTGLAHANRQVRAISARALGFLRAEPAVPALTKTLTTDEWETPRLLAADSLGMIFTEQAMASLDRAKASEKNRDVKLHIDIALRRDSVLEPGAAADLPAIDEAHLGAAEVGASAPDFTLPEPGKKPVTLSRYRGERGVALFFFYGDG